MKTTNHTLGPWKVLDRHNDIHTHITNGAHIVCTLGSTRTDGSPNHYANASLISAAPDLLQVAKDYVLLCQLHNWEGAVLDCAIAAISKAEGVK